MVARLSSGSPANSSNEMNRNDELSLPITNERAGSSVVRNRSKVCPSRSEEIEPAVSAGATKQAVNSSSSMVVPNRVLPSVWRRVRMFVPLVVVGRKAR